MLEHCQVDLERRTVHRGDAVESLTTKEAELLAYLVAQPGVDVTRDELLRGVWGFKGSVPSSRAPDFAMRRLRAKVEADPSRPVHLLTVHGEGYRFVGGRPEGVASSSAAGAVFQAPGAAYDPSWHASRVEAEREASALLAQVGAPVVIVAPRASGKTWLLRHVLRTNRTPDDRVVEIDVGHMDPDGSEGADEALLQLALEAAWAVDAPEESVSLAWERMGHPRRRLTRFLETEVLPRVPGRLVLAIDGADRWQRHGDPSGFFGLLRSWAQRPRAPWDRLRLLLTVSTEPSALVEDPHISPFNLAPAVRLPDLGEAEVRWLAERYGGQWLAADLERLRDQVGGHPLLVRQALYAAARDGVSPASILDSSASEAGVFAAHLRRLVRGVQAIPGLSDGARALLAGRSDVPVSTLYALEAAGVARCGPDGWRIRYRAYQDWLGAHL